MNTNMLYEPYKPCTVIRISENCDQESPKHATVNGNSKIPYNDDNDNGGGGEKADAVPNITIEIGDDGDEFLLCEIKFTKFGDYKHIIYAPIAN